MRQRTRARIPAGENIVAGVPTTDSSSQPIESPEYSRFIPLESVSSAIPCRMLVYQCLLSFLQDVSLAKRSPIASTLHEHHNTMSATDTVSALIKSRESRTALLQAASHLGIGSDPKLRKALQEDETRIATHLMSILDSQTAKEAVLVLEGDSAQHFLDVIQHTLDRGLLIEPEHNSKARRMIIKLSEACDKLPSSLFITGVSGRDDHATFGGGFGDIYRASYDGRTVALKYMRTFHRGSELRRIRLQFCREALIWQHLKHPYILPMLGIDRESFPSSLCMVSLWMENGTVLKYLEEHGRQDVDKLLWEVAQGLEYLHSRNIVHGDLRGANILITQDWSACLTDFGLTTFTDTTAATTTSHRAGTIRWMAPELIEPDRFGLPFRRTSETDVYAFACVCLELYTGQAPFANMTEAGVILKIVHGERPARPSATPPMSEALWKYVNEWWAEDPATRPPAEVIVRNIAITQPSDYTSPIEDASDHDHLQWGSPLYSKYPDSSSDEILPQSLYYPNIMVLHGSADYTHPSMVYPAPNPSIDSTDPEKSNNVLDYLTDHRAKMRRLAKKPKIQSRHPYNDHRSRRPGMRVDLDDIVCRYSESTSAVQDDAGGGSNSPDAHRFELVEISERGPVATSPGYLYYGHDFDVRTSGLVVRESAGFAVADTLSSAEHDLPTFYTGGCG